MTDDPYDRVPQVPTFRITSEDVLDGQPLPRRNASETAGGENLSPQLSWQGFPPQTRSFVVTMYDADAPTPSGFWHWAVADIPGGVGTLPAGDVESLGLDEGASPACLSFALIGHTLARAIIVPWFEAAAAAQAA